MLVIVIIALYVVGIVFMMMADGSDNGTRGKFMAWSLAVLGVASVVAATALLILLGLGKLHL